MDDDTAWSFIFFGGFFIVILLGVQVYTSLTRPFELARTDKLLALRSLDLNDQLIMPTIIPGSLASINGVPTNGVVYSFYVFNAKSFEQIAIITWNFTVGDLPSYTQYVNFYCSKNSIFIVKPLSAVEVYMSFSLISDTPNNIAQKIGNAGSNVIMFNLITEVKS